MAHERCLGEEEGAVVWAAVGEVHEDEDGCFEDFGGVVVGPCLGGWGEGGAGLLLGGSRPVGGGWWVGLSGGWSERGLGADFRVEHLEEAAVAVGFEEMVDHLA